MKALLIAMALLSAIVSISAQHKQILGTWVGKLYFDRAQMPAAPNDAAEKYLREQLAKAEKGTSMTLKLQSKGVAWMLLHRTGLPDKVIDGVWSLSGRSLTVRAIKIGGRAAPPAEAKPQLMVFSADSKKIEFTPPAGMGAKFIFKRSGS
jgi:hypothetical protein